MLLVHSLFFFAFLGVLGVKNLSVLRSTWCETTLLMQALANNFRPNLHEITSLAIETQN